MIKSSLLYKQHENPDCDQLLKVVRYLYSIGYDTMPSLIIERNFPSHITVLPTIIIGQNYYVGIDNIVKYYEQTLKIDDLVNKANIFAQNNPNYRARQKATQKNIIKN